MYLLSKYGKNGIGSVTGLEPGGEWMCEKIFLRTFSVGVQGSVEYKLEIGGRYGRRLSLRHECEAESDIWAEGSGSLGAACLMSVRESFPGNMWMIGARKKAIDWRGQHLLKET
jgi:hypothetical protein